MNCKPAGSTMQEETICFWVRPFLPSIPSCRTWINSFHGRSTSSIGATAGIRAASVELFTNLFGRVLTLVDPGFLRAFLKLSDGDSPQSLHCNPRWQYSLPWWQLRHCSIWVRYSTSSFLGNFGGHSAVVGASLAIAARRRRPSCVAWGTHDGGRPPASRKAALCSAGTKSKLSLIFRHSACCVTG